MTEIKKREGNKVFFDLVLKAEDVKKAEDEVFNKNRQYFQIPGFRKGKAPRKMIENMYGKAVFLEDAINNLLPEAYEAAAKELGLDVVDQPEINIEQANPGEDINVEVSVDVKPEIEIKDYKGIEVEDVKYEVTDELVNNELENQRQLNARVINVDDRAAKLGDKVNIDFVGSVDGVEFEGGAAEGQDLELGSNTFIPGFEDQIVGKNINDEFDVKVTFPEDYFSEDLKGKEAVFKTKLNSISYEELPEVDDEFIKDISDFDTVDEYKEDVKKKKTEEFELRANMEKEEKLLVELSKKVEAEIPAGMTNAQVDSQLQNFDQNLRAQGLDLQGYIKMLGTSIEEFRENLKEDAERQVKETLALEYVAKAEKIDVTEEELDAEIERMATEYFKDDEEQQERMKKYMKESNMEALKENMMNRKTLDFLIENAKFVEPKEEKEEVKED